MTSYICQRILSIRGLKKTLLRCAGIGIPYNPALAPVKTSRRSEDFRETPRLVVDSLQVCTQKQPAKNSTACQHSACASAHATSAFSRPGPVWTACSLHWVRTQPAQNPTACRRSACAAAQTDSALYHPHAVGDSLQLHQQQQQPALAWPSCQHSTGFALPVAVHLR